MIDVVDFFCGCGGTSAGLRDAGMNILAGVDFNKEAGKTYSHNFPKAKFFLEDITNFPTYNLGNLIDKTRKRPLLFAACAPCQPFTKQKTTKRKSDSRLNLLDEFHRFVTVFRPDYILIENVPGLQKIKSDEGALGRFLRLLDKHQYKYDVTVLRSQDYGVPQRRRRLVLVASLVGNIEVPEPTHGPGRDNETFENVWNWIGDLPAIAAGEKHPYVKNHQSAKLSELNLTRIKATPEGGGRLDWPKELMLKCHKSYTGHTDVYGRLHKDRPATAMTTRCISLSNGRYGHPTQSRAISVREAARLQTFDDNFEFFGSINSMAKQIGNAVPVRLAAIIGSHMKSHYQEHLDR